MPSQTKHQKKQMFGKYLDVVKEAAGSFGENYFSQYMPTTNSIINQAKETSKEVREIFTVSAKELNLFDKQYKKVPLFRRINDWFLGEESSYDEYDTSASDWDAEGLDINTDEPIKVELSEATKNANKISKTIVQTTRKSVEMQSAAITANTASLEKLTSTISGGLKDVNSTLNQILEVVTTNTARLVETNLAQYEYRDDTANLVSDKFNASTYAKLVKGNIDNLTMGMGPIVKSLLSGGLKDFLNPQSLLNDTFKGIAEKFDLSSIMENIDNKFSNILMDSVIELDKYKNSEGPLGLISKILGISTDKKTLYNDRPELELGTVTYDAISKEALTNTIPGYLRKILVQLGGPDLVYDYRSRTFRSQGAIKREFEENLINDSGSNLENASNNVKKYFAGASDSNKRGYQMMYDILTNELVNMNTYGDRNDFLLSLRDQSIATDQINKMMSNVDLDESQQQMVNNFASVINTLVQDNSAISDLTHQASKSSVLGRAAAENYINKANAYNIDLSSINPNDINSTDIIAQQYGLYLKDNNNDNNSRLEESLDYIGTTIGTYTNHALYEIYQRLETGVNVFVRGTSKNQRTKAYARRNKLDLPPDFTSYGSSDINESEEYTEVSEESNPYADQNSILNATGENGEELDDFDKVISGFGERGKQIFGAFTSGKPQDVAKIVNASIGDLAGFAKEKIHSGLESINQSFGNITGSIKHFISGKGYSYQERDPETGEMKTVTVEDNEKGGILGFAKDKIKNLFKGVKDKASDWWKTVKGDFSGILSDNDNGIDPITGKKRKGKNNHQKMMSIIGGSIAGAGVGILAGPVGVLMGTIAGGGIGIVNSISDVIKDKLFGRDENGKPTGIFNKVGDALWKPIKFQMDKTMQYVGQKIRKNITGPISDIMMAIKDKATHGIDSAFKSFKKKANKWMSDHVWKPLGDKLKPIFAPVGKKIKDIGKSLIGGLFGLNTSLTGASSRGATAVSTGIMGFGLKGLAKSIGKNALTWPKFDDEGRYFLLDGERFFDVTANKDIDPKDYSNRELARKFEGPNDELLNNKVVKFKYYNDIHELDKNAYNGGKGKTGPGGILITEETQEKYPLKVISADIVKRRQFKRDKETDKITKLLKSKEFKKEWEKAYYSGKTTLKYEDYAAEKVRTQEQEEAIKKDQENNKETADNTKKLLEETQKANEAQAEVNAKVTGEIIPGSSFKTHDQGVHDRLDTIITLMGGTPPDDNIPDIESTPINVTDINPPSDNINIPESEDINDVVSPESTNVFSLADFKKLWKEEYFKNNKPNLKFEEYINQDKAIDPNEIMDSDRETATGFLQSAIQISTNDDGSINKDEKGALDKAIAATKGDKPNLDQASTALSEIINDHSENINEEEKEEKKETIWDKILGGLTGMLGSSGLLGGIKNLLLVGGALAIFFKDPEGVLSIFKGIWNVVSNIGKYIFNGDGSLLGNMAAGAVGLDTEASKEAGTPKRIDTDAAGQHIDHEGVKNLNQDTTNAIGIATIQEMAPRVGGVKVEGPQSALAKAANKGLGKVKTNIAEAAKDSSKMTKTFNSATGRFGLAAGSFIVGNVTGKIVSSGLKNIKDDDGNQMISDTVADVAGRGVETGVSFGLTRDVMKNGANSKMAWLVDKLIDGCNLIGKAITKLLPKAAQSKAGEFFKNLGNTIKSACKQLGSKLINGVDDILVNVGINGGLDELMKKLPVIGGVAGLLDGALAADHLFHGMPGMTTPQMYTASTILQTALGVIGGTGVGSLFVVGIDCIDLLIEENGGKGIIRTIAEWIVGALGGKEGLEESQAAFKAEKEYQIQNNPNMEGMTDASFNDMINPASALSVAVGGYSQVGDDGHIKMVDGQVDKSGGLNKVFGVGELKEIEKDANGKYITNEDGSYRVKTDKFGNELKSDGGWGDDLWNGIKTNIGIGLFGGDEYEKDEFGNDVLDENGERVVKRHVGNIFERTLTGQKLHEDDSDDTKDKIEALNISKSLGKGEITVEEAQARKDELLSNRNQRIEDEKKEKEERLRSLKSEDIEPGKKDDNKGLLSLGLGKIGGTITKSFGAKQMRESKSETITNENGDKVTTIIHGDGSKDITTTRPDGSSFTTHYNEDGEVEIKMNGDMKTKDAGQWMSDKTANIFAPIIDTFNALDKSAEKWNKDDSPWKNSKDSSDWFNSKVDKLWNTVLDPFTSLTEKVKAFKDNLNVDINNTYSSTVNSSSDYVGGDIVDSYSTNEDGQVVNEDGNIVYNETGVPITEKDKDNTTGWSDELNKKVGTNRNTDGTVSTVTFRGGTTQTYIEKITLAHPPEGKKGPYTEIYYYKNGNTTKKYYDINGNLRHINTKTSQGSSDQFFNASGKKLTNRVGAINDPLQDYLTNHMTNPNANHDNQSDRYGAPEDMNKLFGINSKSNLSNNIIGAPDDINNPLDKPAIITSGYGMRPETGNYHKGIDIIPKDGGENANIHSTVDGKVVSVKNNVSDNDTGLNYTGKNASGNEVIIQRDDGLLVRNSHMKSSSIPSNIKIGSRVNAGDKIGKMGSTGRSSGSHLHYELGMPDSMGNIHSLNPTSFKSISGKYKNRIGDTDSMNGGNQQQFQLWINICQNLKEQFANYTYNQSGWKDFTCNGFTIHARLDCSGYVGACISCFTQKKYMSSTGSMINETPPAGFTKMKFPGWDNLYEGDIIIANGHTEIFYGKEGGSYKSWSVGPRGIKDKGPGASNKSKYTWTVLWRPNCSNGTKIDAQGMEATSSGGSSITTGSSTEVGGIIGELIGSLTGLGYNLVEGITGLSFGSSTDSSSDISGGSNIASGKGNFKTYSLTNSEITGLANIVGHEQGTKEGKYAEASLIANQADIHNQTPVQRATSGWFADGKNRIHRNDKADADSIAAVKEVIVGGKRTLPGYVDEHDCWSDIASVSGGGGKNNKAAMKPHTTVIKNNMGSTWKFFTFPGGPNSGNDPFGYTSEDYRSKVGEDFYNIGDSVDTSVLNSDNNSDRFGEPDDMNNINSYSNNLLSNNKSNNPSISYNNRYKRSNRINSNINSKNKSLIQYSIDNSYEYKNNDINENGNIKEYNSTNNNDNKKLETIIEIAGAIYGVLCDINDNTNNTTNSLNELNQKDFVDKGLRESLTKQAASVKKKTATKYIPSNKGNISKVISMARP